MSRKGSAPPQPVIISVSRRTDIPAFYSQWFMNRVRAGVVAVPNPMNRKQAAWVSLRPEDVLGIVFWTKNASPLLPYLSELDALGYRYYFQYTLTGYPREIEPGPPDWTVSVETLTALSERVGPRRLVWRYDPILFTRELDEEYHLRTVARLADALQGRCTRLVISFVDLYRKARANLRRASAGGLGAVSDKPLQMSVPEFAAQLVAIARARGFEVQSCAEAEDLTASGVAPGRCVDPELFGDVFGNRFSDRKDPYQREACGCAASKDIGMYDSCLHGCLYCYANSSDRRAVANRGRLHDPGSACLLGHVEATGSAPCEVQLRLPTE